MEKEFVEKKYVRGNSREKTFESGSPLINFSFNIKKLLSKHEGGIEEYASDDGWVNLTIGVKKETDKYGNTHSIYLNEFKPDPNWKPKSTSQPSDAAPEKEPPF